MVVQTTLLDYLGSSQKKSVIKRVDSNDIMVFSVGVEPRCIHVFDCIRYEIIGRRRGFVVLRVYMPRALRQVLWKKYKECMWGKSGS